MNPDEYDELLTKVRDARERHIANMHLAASSALDLDRLLRQLDAEDSRIAKTVLSRMTAASGTLSTAGSE